MDSSFWFETIKLGRSIVYIKGSQVIISKQKYISFLANSEDPDEMPLLLAFH